MEQGPPPLSSPVAIAREHDLSHFDCGVAALNDYLRKYALANHQNGSARAFYAKFAFVPSPTDSFHLYLLLKDIRKYVRS